VCGGCGGLEALRLAAKVLGPKTIFVPEQTAEYAHLAVETGMFAFKEAVDGVVTHTYIPNRRRPVEDYLQGQGRYRHLCEPTRNAEAIAQIQEQVNRYWSEVTQTMFTENTP
jgi:pyruvate ferredoxin oxidoreductase beta subunit